MNIISKKILIVTFLLTLVVNKIFAKSDVLNMVAKDAPMTFHIKNVPDFIKNWEKSPWSKVCSDKQILDIFKPVFKKFKEEASTEDVNIKDMDEVTQSMLNSTSEVLKSIKSDLVVVLNKLDFDQLSNVAKKLDKNDKNFLPYIDFFILAKVNDDGKKIDEFFHELQKNMSKGFDGKLSIEDNEENSVFYRSLKYVDAKGKEENSLFWGLSGDSVLIAADKNLFIQHLKALSSGSFNDSISSNPSFDKSLEKIGENDAYMFINSGNLVDQIIKLMAKELKNAPNPMMNPTKIIEKLGLKELEAIMVGTKFLEKVINFNSFVHVEKKEGIFKHIVFDKSKGEPNFKFFNADSYSANISTFDVSKFFNGLLSMVAEFMNQDKTQLSQMLFAFTGIDIEKQFLPYLGSNFFVASPNTEKNLGEKTTDISSVLDTSNDMVLGLGIKSINEIESLLESIKNRFQLKNMFKQEDFMGYKLFSFKDKNMGNEGISYALVDDYLVFGMGSDKAIRQILKNMKNPTNSLDSDEQISSIIKGFKPGYVSLSYQNIGSTLHSMVKLMLNVYKNKETNKEKLKFVKGLKIPSQSHFESLFGISVGTEYEDVDGYMTRSVIMSKE